jgi:hypothetical protein
LVLARNVTAPVGREEFNESATVGASRPTGMRTARRVGFGTCRRCGHAGARRFCTSDRPSRCTRRRRATSLTVSSRSAPPRSARRSAAVGVVAIRGADPGMCQPVVTSSAANLGSNRVAKSMGFAVTPWDGWTTPSLPPVMMSHGCESLVAPATPLSTIWEQDVVAAQAPLA